MPVSQAKRRANDEWDAKNMTHIACKVRKEIAEAFKKYAEENSTTANALLKEYVLKCIGKDN